MAKPLQKQQIDKGQVWTTFIGGAVVLFLSTLAIENNAAFFPSIARANKASQDMRKAAEVNIIWGPCGRPCGVGCMHDMRMADLQAGCMLCPTCLHGQ